MGKEKRNVITKLVAGEKVFSSNGFSTIKVTHNGEEKFIDIPIRSIGIEELKGKLQEKAPRPPIKRELVKKNSDEGRNLGLKHDMFVNALDLSDEAYIEKQKEYENNVMWKTAAYAIEIEFVDPKTNEVINDLDMKVKALKDAGITMDHLFTIWKDVMDLTKLYSEELDFLSESSLD